MLGIETRKMHEDIKEDIFTIPSEPYKEGLPLVNTGFSYYQQRQLKGYVAVFTGDFYRLYDRPCPLCVKRGRLKHDSVIRDDTHHILSGVCVLDEDPRVQAAWADIVTVLSSSSQ